jgi:Di-haem cytochrome c peroxidase
MLRAGVALALFAALVVSGMAGDRSFAGSNLPYQHRGYGGPPAVPVAHVTGVAAVNPLIALGEKLFYDTRLSGTGSKSCASCHSPGYGFAEPRWVSISDNGKLGRRNAPTLLDVGFLPRLMWDGRFQSLEQQVFGPFQSGEMGIPIEQAAHRANADPHYVSLFRAALGSFATPGGIAQAIAAWERTLVTPPSRVDRFLANNEYGALRSNAMAMLYSPAGPDAPTAIMCSRCSTAAGRAHARYSPTSSSTTSALAIAPAILTRDASNNPITQLSGPPSARRRCATARGRRLICTTAASERSMRSWSFIMQAAGPTPTFRR